MKELPEIEALASLTFGYAGEEHAKRKLKCLAFKLARDERWRSYYDNYRFLSNSVTLLFIVIPVVIVRNSMTRNRGLLF